MTRRWQKNERMTKGRWTKWKDDDKRRDDKKGMKKWKDDEKEKWKDDKINNDKNETMIRTKWWGWNDNWW